MDNNRQGANSLSIVGRLSTLQSVHYRRFHCNHLHRVIIVLLLCYVSTR